MTNMKLSLVALLASTLVLLTGCDDGVPAVKDPHSIVVDGKPMTALEFYKTYCRDKPTNKTCIEVHDTVSRDSSHGPMPKGY